MRWKTVLLAIMLFVIGWQARAEEKVDVAIVLAVDVSGSVNARRYEQQMRGYSAAFRSADVHSAIAKGRHSSIAVMMIHWSDSTQQTSMTAWTVLRSAEDALAYANALDAIPRAFSGGSTSISGALVYSAELFDDAPVTARKVIDVSGDGANNHGTHPWMIRPHIVKKGITINGLPILTEREPRLDAYYRDFVIGGSGAFMIVAKSYDEFALAIRMKLVLEIAGKMPTVATR